MDSLSRPQRSALMARVRAKNTRPEMVVRKVCRQLGHHYRLNVKDLAGRPDLVFRTRRKAIFVHGCFWHRHQGCAKTRTPKSNVSFWERKFQMNQARDRRTARRLRADGWRVLTVWECQTERSEAIARRVARFLGVPP